MPFSPRTLLAVAASFVLALLLTPLVRAFARRYGFVAAPKSDRWHKKPSAMLGGAYWPLEIVSSRFMQAAANFVPIRHAMEALKGIAYYSYTLQDLLWPLAILVLFGVVFMGVGLRLVERR